jgi:hypothetical protein
MSIESYENVLAFLGVDNQYFTVNASCKTLMLAYDAGVSTAVVVADGTYIASALATALQTAMNAALTMGGTVTWNASTKKFTLSAGAGHTLTYTHSGSNAGLLFGFNQNHAAALTIASDIEVGDPTSTIASIHNGVEAWIKRECKRNFESVAIKETYSGDDTDTLILRQYPIISVSRVAVGRRNVIGVKNTARYSTASVSVVSTGIALSKDGVADETITFAAYTTMSAVVSAINALGNGWVAELQGSDYGSFASTELRPVYGLNCIESSSAYLFIPDLALGDFEVFAGEGFIVSSAVWPKGNNNIYVEYTAGYSAADMPEDLKLAVKILTKHIYQLKTDEAFGVNSYSLAGISQTFRETGVPVQAQRIISSYSPLGG